MKTWCMIEGKLESSDKKMYVARPIGYTAKKTKTCFLPYNIQKWNIGTAKTNVKSKVTQHLTKNRKECYIHMARKLFSLQTKQNVKIRKKVNIFYCIKSKNISAFESSEEDKLPFRKIYLQLHYQQKVSIQHIPLSSPNLWQIDNYSNRKMGKSLRTRTTHMKKLK